MGWSGVEWGNFLQRILPVISIRALRTLGKTHNPTNQATTHLGRDRAKSPSVACLYRPYSRSFWSLATLGEPGPECFGGEEGGGVASVEHARLRM